MVIVMATVMVMVTVLVMVKKKSNSNCNWTPGGFAQVQNGFLGYHEEGLQSGLPREVFTAASSLAQLSIYQQPEVHSWSSGGGGGGGPWLERGTRKPPLSGLPPENQITAPPLPAGRSRAFDRKSAKN